MKGECQRVDCQRDRDRCPDCYDGDLYLSPDCDGDPRKERFLRDECPDCGEKLESFSGEEGIPAHLYCPKCQNVGYDYGGQVIVRYK